MSREWPTPPSDAPLIQLIGDTHEGTTANANRYFRLDKAFADMVDGGQMPAPDIALHVGDMTQNGNPTEGAMIKPRLDALPWDYITTYGEHDNFNAEWTDAAKLAFWGRAAHVEAFNLNFATVVTIPADQTFIDQTVIANLIDAAPNDVIILSHRPLKASYGSPSPTWGPQPDNVGDQAYYLGGSPVVEAQVKALFNARPKVKLICSGHLHVPKDVPSNGLVNRDVNLGNRPITQINASALAYTNQTKGYGIDPLLGVYVSWLGTSIEVRLRAHGAGVWTNGIDPSNPSVRKKVIAL